MADTLIQAIAGGGTLRISCIDGRALVQEAQRVHALSRVATAALGRQLLMTALMTADLKNDTDRLSAIIKGDGAAGSMICTGWPDCKVKGMLQSPDLELPLNEAGKLDVGGFVGRDGTLTVIRDLSLKEPYVGVSRLVSGEIAEDFAQYFTASQQQPSLVYLGVRMQAVTGEVLAAGGMLVQALPGCTEETLDAAAALSEKIAGLSLALEKGVSADDFVQSTFAALSPQILESRVPAYCCDCSRERIERALISVGSEELRDMIERDGGAEVCCDFCHSKYAFSREELTCLLWQASEKERDGGQQ